MIGRGQEDDPTPATRQPVVTGSDLGYNVPRVSQIKSLHDEVTNKQIVTAREVMTEVSGKIGEGVVEAPLDRPHRARMKSSMKPADRQGGLDVVVEDAPKRANHNAKNPKRIGEEMPTGEQRPSHTVLLYSLLKKIKKTHRIPEFNN